MRIAQLTPGSGGTFYCQNCMRDIAMVKALRKLGHDVVMVPLYLPLFVDGSADTANAPVFFGGINVYLQQRFGMFRKTPRWMDRLLDTSWVLKRAAQKEGSTSASELGPMTLSMLNGAQGNQRKELDRLIAWMRDQERPDVIHISNALLLGLAGELKEALGVPIVCSLQDEDYWLDDMGEPYDRLCWEAMGRCAEHVDRFVGVSEWHAGLMAERMGIARDRITVIPLGIDVADIEPDELPYDPPVIGYLSRMNERLGFGRLVDAFIELKQVQRLRRLRLKATGGITPGDKDFVAAQRQKLARHGFERDVQFTPEFERPQRHEFLRSISVMSVPATRGEAFGAFILEALAFGVPVVQPDAGGFTELLEDTKGGLLYDPKDGRGLVDALKGLLLDVDRARELGQQGRQAVCDRYNIESVAARMIAFYESCEAQT